MITLVGTIIATALDPLRVLTAIACGFISARRYAWVTSVATSVAWTLFSAVLWAKAQMGFSVTYLISAIISSLAITSVTHWIRNRSSSKSVPNEMR